MTAHSFPPPPDAVRIRMSDGVELHVARYAAENPRAVVVATHGVQSHAGWFDASSRQLAAAGFDVWFADRRGSGRSDGDRGHARGAERLLRDHDAVISAAREAVPKVPLVLWGVCWGGKITAAAAARRNDIDAAAMLYPALFPRAGQNIWNAVRLGVARFIGVRRRRTRLPLSPDHFTNDPNWQQAIDEDPLALREATVGLVLSGLELDRLRPQRQIDVSVFVGLAGRDVVIRNDRLRRWLSGLPKRPIVKTYPDAAHVLEFEDSRERSTSDMVAWLDETLAGSPARHADG